MSGAGAGAGEGKASDGKASEGKGVDHTCFDWMRSHTVELFPFDRDVVVINARMSREEAYELLAENNILSAPVYDEGRSKYLGMIDMGDIVRYLVQSYEHADVGSSAFASLRALIDKVRAKKSAEVQALVDLSHHNDFKPMPVRTPLLMVVARLAGYPATLGVHRVPIIDPESKKITKIISQSAVISVLAEHIDELGPGMDETLAAAGLAEKPVICTADNGLAFDAFRLMADNNISAVGIVDHETGKLMSSISNSDVKTMLKQNRLVGLTEEAMDFVSSVRMSDAAKTGGKAVAAHVVVRPETTIGDVIKKLSTTHMHRVYVVDAAGKPIGVVSLKDILKRLVVEVGEANNWVDAIYMRKEYVESLGYV